MRSRVIGLVALLALATAFLIACGGDDEKTSTATASGTPTPTATATTAATTTPTGTATATAVTGPSTLNLGDGGVQATDGTALVIPSATLPTAGFVAIHADENGAPGPVIGVSDLLPAGTTTGIIIILEEPLTESGTVYPMIHVDANNNGAYEFPGPDGPATTADGSVAVGPLEVTLVAETPTEEPTTVETRQPDPDAEKYAHDALFGPEVLGEGWSLGSDDDFSDSLSSGFEGTSEACNTLDQKLREADAKSQASRIGRAARDLDGPKDPSNIFGGRSIDQEVNVFDDSTIPEEILSIFSDALEGDTFETCFKETVASQLAPVRVERLDPSAAAPNDGAEAAFSLNFDVQGIKGSIVIEIYLWVHNDSGVTVTLSGSEQDADIAQKSLAAMEEGLTNAE